jgi:DNA-binding MarR family transcriptional regulator
MQTIVERPASASRSGDRLVAEFEDHWEELVRFITGRRLRSSLYRGPAGQLSREQLAALTTLARDDLRMSDLAAELGLSESATTRLVDRLEAAGLVRRIPFESDRRCVVAGLTPEGHRVMDGVREERRQFLKEILQTLPARERAELVRLFGTVASELRARNQEVPV